jgi:hypothetical protein
MERFRVARGPSLHVDDRQGDCRSPCWLQLGVQVRAYEACSLCLILIWKVFEEILDCAKKSACSGMRFVSF